MKYSFLFPDAAVFVSEPSHVAADVGDDVTLRCDVIGNPTPTVQWTRSGSTSVLAFGATLAIRDVSESDFGTYVCRATSQTFASASRSVHLLKNGPPVIVSGNEASARRGSTVTLECDVISQPEAQSVTWHRGEEVTPIQNDKRFTVQQEDTAVGVRSTLEVRSVQESDFVEWNCTVTNERGATSHLIALKEEGETEFISTATATEENIW